MDISQCKVNHHKSICHLWEALVYINIYDSLQMLDLQYTSAFPTAKQPWIYSVFLSFSGLS